MDTSSITEGLTASEWQMEYAVKCVQMARQSEAVSGDASEELIHDAVEISNEAMAKCLEELGAKF